jgi:flavin-dependent dehydrogenase
LEKIKTKICIIGGGPAGASTSIFLGKAGIEHLLVDAAEFPRDKVCGDGIDLNVVRVLNHMDPSIVENELMAEDSLFSISPGIRLSLATEKMLILLEKRRIARLTEFFKNPFFL